MRTWGLRLSGKRPTAYRSMHWLFHARGLGSIAFVGPPRRSPIKSPRPNALARANYDAFAKTDAFDERTPASLSNALRTVFVVISRSHQKS